MSFESFLYRQDELHVVAQTVLESAQKKNISASTVELSEGQGLSVSVRKGELENVEHNQDKSLDITVYLGKQGALQRGHASTNDFSADALIRTLNAAHQIAAVTSPDPFAGLPDRDLLYRPSAADSDLQLFHPWSISVGAAIELGQKIEAAAFATDTKIRNSEGANVYAQHQQFVYATSDGLILGDRSSSHSISMVPIAQKGHLMQRDSWYSQARDAEKLADATALGRYAAQRALAKLNVGTIATQTCPVLFDAPIAVGLLGALTHALSGSTQYRKDTFLLASLGQTIFPEFIDVIEDPFIKGANGSSYFDAEGVRTQKRHLVEHGCVQAYVLSSYSARQLNLATTGNAGGAHNLHLVSKNTRMSDDFLSMIKKMDRGLLVTELMGSGTNYVTGDYSRGAGGYWVENGQIQFAVEGITIAGNLRQMYRDIVAVGNDRITRGNKTTGSVLIGSMRVASN